MQVIKRFTAFLLIGALITACGGGGGGGSSAPTVPPAGATPPAATPPTASASVSGGTFADTQIVTLSSDQASATLYFTLDDTSPTTSSPTYSDSIAINETATLQFFARSSHNAGCKHTCLAHNLKSLQAYNFELLIYEVVIPQ